MIRMRKTIQVLTLLGVAFLLLATACKREEKEALVVMEKPDTCPISTIPDSLSLVPSDVQTYPLPSGFLTEFLKRAQQYEGVHVHLASQLPQEWSLLYREPLTSNQELWMVRSDDGDWTYLVIAVGEHVRDVVPVAVDLASTGAIIESEKWSWTRDASGAFLVYKHYEKRPDFRDTTQRQCDIYAVDRYLVGTSGLFECSPMTLSEGPEYQLAVLYTTTENLPDTWFDVINDLAPYCEENNIIFLTLTASDNFRQVDVEDYQMNPVVTLDLSRFVQNDEAGIILMSSSQEPQVENYSGNTRFLQMKIRNYFNNIINL